MQKIRFKRKIRFWFYKKLYAEKPNLKTVNQKNQYTVHNLNFFEKHFLLLINKITN